MQNPTTVCGNCGRPVAASDVTCPHCDVLLAAYSSPSGSTSAHVYESSEPIPDAVPQAEVFVPDPAPPVVIPDKVDVVSTAPRPLFDTQLTIEEISKAAEGDHEESLVVVSEKKVATKPVVFDVPDYAKPPSDAAPVQLVEGGNEDLIARAHDDNGNASQPPVRDLPSPPPPAGPDVASPAETHSEARESDESAEDEDPEPARSQSAIPSYAVPPSRVEPANRASEPDASEEPEAESWLYDLSKDGPAARPRAPKREHVAKPKPDRDTRPAPSERGRTDAYLQRLHEESGYDSSKAQLSRPVGSGTSTVGRTVQRARRMVAGTSDEQEVSQETLDKRKGCLGTLYLSSVIIWFVTLGTILSGNPNAFLIVVSAMLVIVMKQKNKIFEFLESL